MNDTATVQRHIDTARLLLGDAIPQGGNFVEWRGFPPRRPGPELSTL